ncbi:restriction endonuclease [Clavibacter michiganensis subsp. michiganensis]|uniref:TIGR02391 family protein n=1 Tax=Clavibacter michiganensis TaxID=28447 RepID=UPI0013651A37|nr:TIGR02391 family protein [Clavibacter michiganensis]MWJ85022.1 restriction endonuclease [Clavibacter michiganensis subsp. michiganensis]
MTGLNTDWAIEQLDKFIEQTVMRNGSGAGFITTTDYTAAPEAEVAKQAQIVEKILARVTPNWRDELTGQMANNRWAKHREAAIRAREELVRAEEIGQNLGDDAPEISAADLHPWIWSGARSLWQSGHYVQAVRDAVTKLNAETQNKVGRRDVSETDLFKQSFSLDEAKPGKSRLRMMTPDDSDTYRSVQRGAMSLAEGVFAGIRNPLSHEADQELSEQVALEYLASLSVLARWVDESNVEQSGRTS